MAKVILIAGSTGAGKSTYAASLKKELGGAVIFSIDEWMANLFWKDAPPASDLAWALERVRRCEEEIWLVARQVLFAKLPVILDLGFSKKAQRDLFRERASAEGHEPELHFLDTSVALRRARVRERNEKKGDTFKFEVDEKMFDWMEGYFERPGPEELKGAIIPQG